MNINVKTLTQSLEIIRDKGNCNIVTRSYSELRKIERKLTVDECAGIRAGLDRKSTGGGAEEFNARIRLAIEKYR